jgi:hypothetical protein
MTQWVEVDSWLGFFANVWIGIVVLIAAAVPTWMAAKNNRSIKDNHNSIKEETKIIRAQLVNGHQQPMRFDLDRILHAMELLSLDIKSVKEDLISEEERRRIQINDIRQEIHHRFDNMPSGQCFAHRLQGHNDHSE